MLALLDEIDLMRKRLHDRCTCEHGDPSAPIVKHDKDCPIRVNIRTRIAPEVAMDRLAAALHSGDENEALEQQLVAMTAARNELVAIALRHTDAWSDPVDFPRIAELGKVGSK